MLRFLRPDCNAVEIRTQIESQISVRERISTLAEVPITQESEQILNRAMAESDRLGHRHVGTEHLLLGIFVSEVSFAARLLRERGANLEVIREQLAKTLYLAEERDSCDAPYDDARPCAGERGLGDLSASGYSNH